MKTVLIKSLKPLKLIVATALLSSLLTGCMSRMQQDSDTQAAEAVVSNFLKYSVSKDGPALKGLVSNPFWLERWYPDADGFIDEFVQDVSDDAHIPKPSGVVFRVYPIGDLAAIRPKVWLALKRQSTPEQLQNLYLGAAAIDFEDRDKYEGGLLLLRKVEGRWSLAGLIEE